MGVRTIFVLRADLRWAEETNLNVIIRIVISGNKKIILRYAYTYAYIHRRGRPKYWDSLCSSLNKKFVTLHLVTPGTPQIHCHPVVLTASVISIHINQRTNGNIFWTTSIKGEATQTVSREKCMLIISALWQPILWRIFEHFVSCRRLYHWRPL